MTERTLIDPIAVDEERLRFEGRGVHIRSGIGAATALLWFSEHARLGKLGVKGILSKDVVDPRGLKLIASGVPGAADAQRYLTEAVSAMLPAILEEAVKRANNEYEQALDNINGVT